jgi:dCMP deaminase
MRKIPGWDEHFLDIAKLCSQRSKDESTQIGAVIVGVDKEIVATGYNSFPRKINDNVPERQQRPEKYFWFEHAERNAIYNAARHGASLKDCTLYVPAMPCADCARGIVQVGIKRVVVDAKENDAWLQRSPKWREHMERSLQLFSEADVRVDFWEKKDE